MRQNLFFYTVNDTTPNGSRSLAPSKAAANCLSLYTTLCGGEAREWPTKSGVIFRRQLATSSAAACWVGFIS